MYYLLLSIFSLEVVVSKNYFCDLRCGHHQHFVCHMKPCRIEDILCRRSGRMRGFGQQDISSATSWHNSIRSNVTNFIQGNASVFAPFMNLIMWDKELQFMAQCWANTCAKYNIKAPCTTTSRFKKPGLVDFVFKSERGKHVATLTILEEVFGLLHYQHIPLKMIDSFDPMWADKQKVFQLAQILIENNTHFGCGMSIFGGNIAEYQIVCCYSEYYMSYKGKPLFRRKDTPTNCPSCTYPSKEYPNLNGSFKELRESLNSSWKQPFEIDGDNDRIFDDEYDENAAGVLYVFWALCATEVLIRLV